MYERLTDKTATPSEDFIKEYIGQEGYTLLAGLEDFLTIHYVLTRELKFPFGNHYGWGFKYSHKALHLCHVFFEAGAFTVTLQLGDKCVTRVEQILPQLSQKAGELWQKRYPCGEKGGWIHYRVTDESCLKDILTLIKIKKPPVA